MFLNYFSYENWSMKYLKHELLAAVAFFNNNLYNLRFKKLFSLLDRWTHYTICFN